MFDIEIGTTWGRAGLVAVSSVAMLFGIIAYIRIIGLRSFSKMSTFDFAVTVAIGSLLGTVALSASSLADGLIAVGVLLATQALVAWGRFYGLGRFVDNEPVVLVANGRFLEDNMRATRVSASDIRAKLREANIADLSEVKAVILETTGDVSVIHGKDGPMDPELLEDVRDGDKII